MAQSQETAKAVKKTSVRKVRAPGAEKTASQKAEAPKKSNVHVQHPTLAEFCTTDTHARVKVLESAGMTPRYQRALYALRKVYGNKNFPAGGLDAGIVRSLVGAKMVSLSGGQQTSVNGIPYMIDGEKPLMASITAAGQKYGTV